MWSFLSQALGLRPRSSSVQQGHVISTVPIGFTGDFAVSFVGDHPSRNVVWKEWTFTKLLLWLWPLFFQEAFYIDLQGIGEILVSIGSLFPFPNWPGA